MLIYLQFVRMGVVLSPLRVSPSVPACISSEFPVFVLLDLAISMEFVGPSALLLLLPFSRVILCSPKTILSS